MDSILFSAWQNTEPPFDGLTLTVKQAVPLETLVSVLATIVEQLQENFGGEPLHFVMDWHEHDGVVLPSKSTSWGILKSEVETASKLSNFVFGDWEVRRGFYPESQQFYLRFYVNEERDWAGPQADGDFDLTVTNDLAKVFTPILSERLGDNLKIAPASPFFNERYSG